MQVPYPHASDRDARIPSVCIMCYQPSSCQRPDRSIKEKNTRHDQLSLFQFYCVLLIFKHLLQSSIKRQHATLDCELYCAGGGINSRGEGGGAETFITT